MLVGEVPPKALGVASAPRAQAHETGRKRAERYNTLNWVFPVAVEGEVAAFWRDGGQRASPHLLRGDDSLQAAHGVVQTGNPPAIQIKL